MYYLYLDQELYQFMKEPIDTTDMDAVLTPMPGVCVAITVQPGSFTVFAAME